MCEPQQDVHDGTLGVDDESHDGDEQVRDGALPVQDDDGDALVLDGGDGVPEQVHGGGEAQVPDHDDALQVLELDDELVHDAQDVVRALLLLVLLDDVRHREQVLPHDYHLCSLVLPMHVHHDYCLLAQTYAVELHHYVSAVRKLTLT